MNSNFVNDCRCKSLFKVFWILLGTFSFQLSVQADGVKNVDSEKTLKNCDSLINKTLRAFRLGEFDHPENSVTKTKKTIHFKSGDEMVVHRFYPIPGMAPLSAKEKSSFVDVFEVNKDQFQVMVGAKTKAGELYQYVFRNGSSCKVESVELALTAPTGHEKYPRMLHLDKESCQGALAPGYFPAYSAAERDTPEFRKKLIAKNLQSISEKCRQYFLFENNATANVPANLSEGHPAPRAAVIDLDDGFVGDLK